MCRFNVFDGNFNTKYPLAGQKSKTFHGTIVQKNSQTLLKYIDNWSLQPFITDLYCFPFYKENVTLLQGALRKLLKNSENSEKNK